VRIVPGLPFAGTFDLTHATLAFTEAWLAEHDVLEGLPACRLLALALLVLGCEHLGIGELQQSGVALAGRLHQTPKHPSVTSVIALPERCMRAGAAALPRCDHSRSTLALPGTLVAAAGP
jgi:hypothetical protein